MTAAARHRLGEERGQGLVEYALIIAIVSLGAVVALGFMSGKIQSLFSKTGNSLNNVTVAQGGGPSGPPPPAAPPNGTGLNGTNTTASSNLGALPVWRTSAFSCTFSSFQYHCTTPFTPPQGGAVFAFAAGGGSCSFTYSNGYQYNGTWTVASGIPALPAWNATSDANAGIFVDYFAACL